MTTDSNSPREHRAGAGVCPRTKTPVIAIAVRGADGKAGTMQNERRAHV